MRTGESSPLGLRYRIAFIFPCATGTRSGRWSRRLGEEHTQAPGTRNTKVSPLPGRSSLSHRFLPPTKQQPPRQGEETVGPACEVLDAGAWSAMSGPVSLCACALVGSGVCPVTRTPRHGVGAYPLPSRQHLCTSRRLWPVCGAGPRWRFLGPSTQRAEDRRPYSSVPGVDIDELGVGGRAWEELGTV